jgi:hypothetical protein
MPDEFEQIRNAMVKNGKGPLSDDNLRSQIAMILDNQREILACLATIARGGILPISIARDLQDRAKKISKILEG